MSRFFDGDSNQVLTPSSPASDNLPALTLSLWILVTDYGAFGFPPIVKDSATAYNPSLYVEDEGQIFATAGAAYLGGTSGPTVVAGGNGYVNGDTGVIIGGNPDTPDNRATYTVNTSGAGHVVTVGNPANGTGYAAGQTYATLATSGVGSGLTLLNNGIIDQTQASSVSLAAIPLHAWVHLAMTWDSTGDKLVHLYINGVEVTYISQRSISNAAGSDAASGWSLGKDTYGDAGTIQQKQTAVFNRALTASEVAALAALPDTVRGVADTNLVAYWPLTSANPEPDLSGSGTDGEILTQTPAETAASTTPLNQVSMVTPVASASMN